MESYEGPNPEAQKEILREKCLLKAWEMFVNDLESVESKKGKDIQHDLLISLTLKERFFYRDWEKRLKIIASRKREAEIDRQKKLSYPQISFTDTEAKVFLMTTNARYKQLAEAEGRAEELPEGYKKFMEGLRATMPWNRSGYNLVRPEDVTIEDLNEALQYMQSRLSKE